MSPLRWGDIEESRCSYMETKKQRKTNRNNDELMDWNTEYTKILDFKVTEKEKKKHYILATGFLKCMRIQ